MPKQQAIKKGNNQKGAKKVEEKKTEDKKVTKQEITVIVKKVLDGASFEYIEKGSKDAKWKLAVIQGIMAPHYDKKENKEEKFTFESTEFLRKKIIGKTLKLVVENTTEKGMRFVTPMLDNKNLAAEIVAEGWAANKGKQYATECNEAKEAKKGVWGTKEAIPRPAKDEKVKNNFLEKEKEFDGSIQFA